MQDLTLGKPAAIGWIFLLAWLFPILCYPGESGGGAPPRVGGACEYKHYHGTAEIISVVLIGSAIERSQDEYEVKCRFTPREVIREPFTRAPSREFLLTDQQGMSPRRAFLDRHGIQAGKRFDCIMKVIVQGTCTPVIYELPWMKRAGSPRAQCC